MSHFAVLVVGDDIEKQLAPFQENNMGDCPKEYLAFHDKTEELKEDFETDTTLGVRGPRGGTYSGYDKRFKNPRWSMTYTRGEPNEPEYVYPEGYTVVEEMPVKELYGTLDEYATKYHGYKKDPDTGLYGYWENPNAKWDWFVVGGRYAGRLVMKDGHVTDSAPVGELDLDGMLRARQESFREQYRAAMKEMGDPGMRKFIYGVEEGATEEQHVAKAKALSAFAVLKDGKWYEKGEMGWWAMVSNEKDDDAWDREFDLLIKSLPPETRITFVDCHI